MDRDNQVLLVDPPALLFPRRQVEGKIQESLASNHDKNEDSFTARNYGSLVTPVLHDTTLVRKLETYAEGKSANDSILTKEEATRGSILLSQAEETLAFAEKKYDPATSESIEAQKALIAKLLIALAPHKRLPAEILSKIFEYLFSEHPERPNSMSWVLGRVCSRWRLISRNNKQLWGLPHIDLHGGNPPTRGKAQRLLDLLPPDIHLSISCMNLNVVDDKLVSYIRPCECLMFVGDIDAYGGVWKLSPNTFVNLRKVTLSCGYFPPRSKIEYNVSEAQLTSTPGPFRMASRIHTVELLSLGPWRTLLMFTGIPWGHVRNLKIRLEVTLPELCTFLKQFSSLETLSAETAWMPQLNGTDAALCTDALHFLSLRKLQLYEKEITLVPVICSWAQLTSLDIIESLCSAQQLEDVLRRCSALQHLSLCINEHFDTGAIGHLHLPSLRRLEIQNEAPQSQLFAKLTLCQLEHLEMHNRHRVYEDIFNLPDMLKRSQCPLSGIAFRARSQLGITLDLMDRIFTIISPTATSVIFPRTVFPDSLLHSIGGGQLLPNLKKLECVAPTPTSVVKMMEAFATRRAQLHGNKSFWFWTDFVTQVEAQDLSNLCHLHDIQLNIGSKKLQFINLTMGMADNLASSLFGG